MQYYCIVFLYGKYNVRMSKSKGGWEKLKDAQIKKKNETEVFKKVIPLTSHFKPKITLESDNLNTTASTL